MEEPLNVSSYEDPDNLVPRAREFAQALHAGQVDKGGAPYFEHLEAVATILIRDGYGVPAFAVAAAYLHDALEDTEATPESLAVAGIPERTIELVQALTRPPGTPYLDWIRKLAATENKWAIQIKLADNAHNSDPVCRLRGSDIIERRYAPARAILEHSLYMAKFDDFDGPPMDGCTGITLSAHLESVIADVRAEGARRRAAFRAKKTS